eukprot:TRINITY_DN10192_c0_g1_i1.p1 TRINITY_DN10192_c0_g1~~TRINITY_DN10192_c0_g1_i1.p1  ORF type:complete len:1002 (-),score=250.20 TRINITY_DN10192_c0_g1_i1:1090-4095(-)
MQLRLLSVIALLVRLDVGFALRPTEFEFQASTSDQIPPSDRPTVSGASTSTRAATGVDSNKEAAPSQAPDAHLPAQAQEQGAREGGVEAAAPARATEDGSKSSAKSGAAATDTSEGLHHTTGAPLLLSNWTTGEDVEKRLVEAIQQRDVAALKRRLDMLEEELRKDPKVFDISQPFVDVGLLASKNASSRRQEEAGSHGGSASGSRITVLAAAAAAGWSEGLRELLSWEEAREDAAERLQLESDGARSTPLLHAVRHGHAAAVLVLMNARASTVTPDKAMITPLEAAAAQPKSGVVEVLLTAGFGLEDGLAPLRARLTQAAEKLPVAVDRWPIGPSRDDGLDGLRELLPAAIGRDTGNDDDMYVGGLALDRVFLYMNRVMCAAAGLASSGIPPAAGGSGKEGASSSDSDAKATEATAAVLVAHGYASFMTQYTLAAVIMGLFAALASILVYSTFRLRVYGCGAASASFADLLPGAFDPVRFVDQDFDPSRQRTKLPYRGMRDRLGGPRCNIIVMITAFCAAIAGVFNAWLFLCIRIPPEKDIYDEDYASDDDDMSRLHVRSLCAARARLIRATELLLRNIALLVVVWWFAVRAKRIEVIVLLASAYGLHALLAACLASSTVPASAEGEHYAKGGVDAAQLVYSLFAPQYGARWARAVCTTRSTAAPSRSKLQKRKARPGKSGPKDLGGHCSATSGDDGWEDALLSDKETSSTCRAGGGEGGEQPCPSEAQAAPKVNRSQFAISFQRSFLQVGLMHTQHGSFVGRALFTFVTVCAAVLWLLHVNALSGFALLPLRQYSEHSPAELFKVYGAPRSAHRWTAVLFEILLVGIVVERLFCSVNCMNVANLVLQQRRIALAFAATHLPPKGLEKERRLQEACKCVRLATELSGLRWLTLRSTVAAALAIVSTTFVLSSVLSLTLLRYGHALTPANFVGGGLYSPDRVLAPAASAWWKRLPCSPFAPLCLALCFFWPVFATLLEGARSNRDLRAYIAKAPPSGQERH